MTAQGFTRPARALGYGPNGPAWVYRHVGADGATLYIGYTTQPEKRQPAHRNKSQWFPLVAEIIYHGPFTLDEASDLEQRLIGAEEPPFNRQGTSRVRGKLPTAHTEAWIDAQAEEAQGQAVKQ